MKSTWMMRLGLTGSAMCAAWVGVALIVAY